MEKFTHGKITLIREDKKIRCFYGKELISFLGTLQTKGKLRFTYKNKEVEANTLERLLKKLRQFSYVVLVSEELQEALKKYLPKSGLDRQVSLRGY